MPDAPAAITLLIKVVLPQDVAWGIKGGSEYAAPTARSVPVRLHLNARGGPAPPSVKLRDIWLRGADLEQYFPEQSVPLDTDGTGTVDLPGGTVFPCPGLFWLEATASAPGYAIETEQLNLQGIVGRGWSEEGAKSHWRSPVIAVDVLALTQARLNNAVFGLSILVVFIAVAQLAVSLWPQMSIGPSQDSSVPAPSSAPLNRAGKGKANPAPPAQDPRQLR